MIEGLFNRGAMQSVERLVQFTGERHRLLSHNIANLSTPHFRPRDVEPGEFQSALRQAQADRRSSGTPHVGQLEMRDTRNMSFRRDGIDVRARDSNRNILFHDRNNRDLERTMQDLAENTLAHNTGIELLKNQFEMLKLAIRERV
ncbi:MAG: hypothetical protein WD118_01500 [Phycisphaeraceae bacterium]